MIYEPLQRRGRDDYTGCFFLNICAPYNLLYITHVYIVRNDYRQRCVLSVRRLLLVPNRIEIYSSACVQYVVVVYYYTHECIFDQLSK